MKILLNKEAEIEISDWNTNSKVFTIVFAVIAIVFYVLYLFTNIAVPGLIPIAIGCTMLGLGIREYNIYFKRNKHFLILLTAVLCTLLFVICLRIGIEQIILNRLHWSFLR